MEFQKKFERLFPGYNLIIVGAYTLEEKDIFYKNPRTWIVSPYQNAHYFDTLGKEVLTIQIGPSAMTPEGFALFWDSDTFPYCYGIYCPTFEGAIDTGNKIMAAMLEYVANPGDQLNEWIARSCLMVHYTDFEKV